MSQNAASFDAGFWDMPMRVKFLADPIEAADQLSLWRLNRPMLIEAVFFARSFYTDCTANDPLGFNHVISYARAARRLRDLLGPQGWLRDDSNNQTAVRHEDLRLRLYPCNFCSYTANPHHQPVNLHDKGAAAKGDAYSNAQLPLPLLEIPAVVSDIASNKSERYTTLLLGMNFESEYAKAEISVPVRFSDGKFKGLAIRVPLLDGTQQGPEPIREEAPSSLFGIVDIPISRKL
jgi:hypothetical protein